MAAAGAGGGQSLCPHAGSDADFYRGKLQAARYYIEWELPEIQHQANLLRGKSDVCLTMQDGWF